MSRRFRPPVLREEFTRVKNLSTEAEGIIESVLSSQVTVRWEDGGVSFLMNADYGNEWITIDNNIGEGV